MINFTTQGAVETFIYWGTRKSRLSRTDIEEMRKRMKLKIGTDIIIRNIVQL